MLQTGTGLITVDEAAPHARTKQIALKHDCDLAIPNGRGTGIGNVLMYTRLVEELGRNLGRPLRLLTAPLEPAVGVVDGEEPYPIWRHNPHVHSIVNANDIDPNIMLYLQRDRENFAQFNHIIENLCHVYAVRPRALSPVIYLSEHEQRWAMESLCHLPRPVVCLHPYGTTSSRNNSPWHTSNWLRVIKSHPSASFIQIGNATIDNKELPAFSFRTTLRQAMALIWASDIFVGFDSSPMHMATAFSLPVCAIFDMHEKAESEQRFDVGFTPSVMLRWSYPQNRNIALLGEKDNESVTLVNRFIREQIELISC